MLPGRTATAVRALRLLARRVEWRASILDQVALPSSVQSAVELKCLAQQLRRAADKILRRNNQRGERMNRHRVYMRYEQMMGSWRVSFTNHDSRSRFRDLTFADADKIRDLARRAGALSDLASKQALDLGIRSRQGGLVLELTDDQFRALRV